MQLVVLVGALLAALFLVLLQMPVPGASVMMPTLGLAWVVGLPLALGAAAVSDLPPLPEAAERLLPDSTRELDDERRDAIWCVCWTLRAVGVGTTLCLPPLQPCLRPTTNPSPWLPSHAPSHAGPPSWPSMPPSRCCWPLP